MTSSNPTDSIQLLEQWRAGDQHAAQIIFQRYANRLVALVRTKLSEKFSRRVDAEDVVQSACRSFFVGTRNGRYIIEQSGDLWRLLVAIAVHKLHHQISRHSAEKRSVVREAYFVDGDKLFDQFANEFVEIPSSREALVLSDEIEDVIRSLNEAEQRMLELRLEGYTLDEIARDVNRSQRTVRRTMDRVKQYMVGKYPEFFCREESTI